MKHDTGERTMLVGLGTQLRTMAEQPGSGYYIHHGMLNPAVLKTPDDASGVFVTVPEQPELLIFDRLAHEQSVDLAASGLATNVLYFPRHRRTTSLRQ